MMSLIRSNFPVWPEISEFFGDEWMEPKLGNGGWSPAINVIKNDNSYEIEIAAPGFNKKDFNVNIENKILRISGKTEMKDEEKKRNYTRKEFGSRSFVKDFSLPENIIEDRIDAKYEDGVLHVTLHKLDKKVTPKKEIKVL